MFCENCGDRVDDSARFCAKCGRAIYESSQPQKPYLTPVQQPSLPPAAKSKMAMVALTTGIISLVSLIVSVIITFTVGRLHGDGTIYFSSTEFISPVAFALIAVFISLVGIILSGITALRAKRLGLLKKQSYPALAISVLSCVLAIVWVSYMVFVSGVIGPNLPRYVPHVSSSQPPTSSYAPGKPDAPETPSPPEVMPWEIGYENSWTETVRDGFELGLAVRIWEPIQCADTAHPGNSELMAVPEGYDGAQAWVVPFEITASNETSGFGALSADFLIGSTHGGGSGLREEDNAGDTLLLKAQSDVSDEARERADVRATQEGLPRLMCMMTSDTSRKQAAFNHVIELDEGERVTRCGYLVFVDAKRTPNIPNGVDAEWFEKTTVIIAAGSEYGMGNYACQRLVKLTKDGDGNLVFGKEYEVYVQE